MLHLFGGLDVVLEVTASVLPCLETLQEELSSLTGVLIWDGIVVVGDGASREVLLCVRHDGGVCSLSAQEVVSLFAGGSVWSSEFREDGTNAEQRACDICIRIICRSWVGS